MYGGALRVLAEIGTQALRIWGAHQVFSKAGHRRSAYEQGGGHTLRSQGFGNSGTSRSQKQTSIAYWRATHRVLPKAKHRLLGREIGYSGERFMEGPRSRKTLRLERTHGCRDPERGWEEDTLPPEQRLSLCPCTTFRRDPWMHSSRTAKAHVDEHMP